MTRIYSAIDQFWFRPVNPVGLHILRGMTGIVLLTWLLGYAGSYQDLLGPNGWFDQQAYEDVAKPRVRSATPVPLPWGRTLIAPNESAFAVQYWASVLVAALFTAGIATRFTAPLAWLTVVAFTSNPVMDYGGDDILLMLMLYMALAYLLIGMRTSHSSLDGLLGTSEAMPHRWKSLAANADASSVWANVILRLIQIHTAIIVVMTGLAKLQDAEWWAGDALWYPMHPPFEMSPEQIQNLLDSQGQADALLALYSLAAYVTLFWQLNFPWIAWWKPVRWLAVTGAIIGCLGCWFVYRLPVFGPGLVIGTLAFIPDESWKRLIGRWTNSAESISHEFPRPEAIRHGRTG